jgi:hypothetical protein
MSAIANLDREYRDARAALDFIAAAEKQIRIAAHVVFDRNAEQIEVMSGMTVDRAVFDATLTDALTDAFHEPRKVLGKAVYRLEGQIHLRELAGDRADYFSRAAE